MESKYQKGKIYKIVDVGYTKCYVGSTCEALSARMSKHRYDYRMSQDGTRPACSSFLLFEEFGIENCKIELIERFPCDTKEQLRQQEGKHIRDLDCVNKHVAGRSRQEYWAKYYLDNVEKIQEYHSQYYRNNLARMSEHAKQYRCDNRDKLKEYEKQYRTTHQEQYKEKSRAYYLEHKDKVKERRNKQHECSVCGGRYTHANKMPHTRSKKHQAALNERLSFP